MGKTEIPWNKLSKQKQNNIMDRTIRTQAQNCCNKSTAKNFSLRFIICHKYIEYMDYKIQCIENTSKTY